MNTMMLALLQGRLWDTASSLQQRLRTPRADGDSPADPALAGELSLVFKALDAVQAGRYGYCDECDQPLEPDQLLVQPYRLLCNECEALCPDSHKLSRRRGGAAPN